MVDALCELEIQMLKCLEISSFEEKGNEHEV
jgi:hypothetical protein